MTATEHPESCRSALIQHLADMLQPEGRSPAIANLSHQLDVETFLLFLPDRELGRRLVAPGFPQTLPDARAWQHFIAATEQGRRHAAALPWPTPANYMPAIGALVPPDSIVVFLGGQPERKSVDQFVELLPLVVPGLACERTVASIRVQLQLAQHVTRESAALAASLDEARRAAQAEIAARKNAEAALREARDDLARINAELELRVRERTQKLHDTIAELEAFSYTVSHDLRSPLRSMYGYANVLLEDSADKLDAGEREQLGRIARAAERLDRLIQDVLRYSRVARTEIKLQPLSLERIVRHVVAESPVLRGFQHQIEIVSPMPVVYAHDVLLGQAVSNLLLNAVKFVAPGVTPVVRVWTEEMDKLVRLWVEDNGIGIATQHVARIFGMFERIHPESMFEGTGIGLAIVKRATNRLGGDVGVESIPGQGSRFWVTLQRVSDPPG